MPAIKQMTRIANHAASNRINWFPGHMYSGMKAMMGKLRTVDCIIEVHDARIPLIGRNAEFRKHLGLIKPHVLVLNKADLADLTNWTEVRKRLQEQGDENVFLTDCTGDQFSHANRGYTKIMDRVVKMVSGSEAYNRTSSTDYRVMIVGIPNVGKSTLINRLRQHHLGLGGQAAKVGPEAGVTRHVDNKIKICARPPVYSLDTPGVLEPTVTRNHHDQMALALCSTINDRVLNPDHLVKYLLKFFEKTNNLMYVEVYDLERPAKNCADLYASPKFRDIFVCEQREVITNKVKITPNLQRVGWQFIKDFRTGMFGKVMLV